jgi:apolipoprotein N-acyltransferase
MRRRPSNGRPALLRNAQIPERLKGPSAVLAGALLPLAFAPFRLFWLAPLSYAVLFSLWRETAPKRAFSLGFLYGFASFLAGLYWIYISVREFGELPIPISLLLTVALPAALALYVAGVGWTAARWFPTMGLRAWLGVYPALWVSAEWLRGWLLTGFGWLSAGYSQTDSWLIGYAPVVGVYGIGWLVALCAGAGVALAVGSRRERFVAGAVVLAVFGAGYALTAQRWTAPLGDPLSVALVQGAIPQTLKYEPEQLPITFDLYRRLTEAHHGRDLIVWPEAAIPELYERLERPLKDIARDAREHGSALLLGILRDHPPTGTFQNAFYAMSDPPEVYTKRHLVPFGEYYPVPGFVRNWLRLANLPSTDAAPGDPGQPPLELAGQRIAVTICYEDLFGAEQLHYMPDATLLVNVSNDAWFGDSIAPHQHLQIARMRAVEVGRYQLRATNTGITAVIEPSGRVAATLPAFEAGVLTATVQGYTGLTPYARWGNAPVVIGALLVLVLVPVFRFRKLTSR